MVLHVLDISSVDLLGSSQRWKNQQVRKYKLEKLESESGQKKQTVRPISCMALEMVERFFVFLTVVWHEQISQRIICHDP